jgi:hypothetical protein
MLKRPMVGSHLSTLDSSTSDPYAKRPVHSIYMLREELDFYLLKFVDEDSVSSSSSNKNLFKIMRSSVGSKKSVENIERSSSMGSIKSESSKLPNLSAYGTQIKQVCQEHFKSQLKVQTMSDSTAEDKVRGSTPTGHSSFSHLYVYYGINYLERRVIL